MTRVTLATLGALLVLGVLGVVVARAFGASASRPAAVVTVASHWIAAWGLWTFVGALAVQAGVMTAYEPAVFALVALAGGWLQYRALVRGALERARAIFVGGQLGWLVVVLVHNGLLSS